MTTPQPAALPELPEPVANVSASNPISGIGFVKPDKPYYTAEQMRAYALAALQSAQPAEVSDEEIAAIHDGMFPAPYEGHANVIKFARAILALRPQAVPMPCTWEQEDECGSAYSTTCGNTFMFEDGGPSDNGAKFCCYCGGRLSEQKWVEPADDDGITAQGAQGGEG